MSHGNWQDWGWGDTSFDPVSLHRKMTDIKNLLTEFVDDYGFPKLRAIIHVVLAQTDPLWRGDFIDDFRTILDQLGGERFEDFEDLNNSISEFFKVKESAEKRAALLAERAVLVRFQDDVAVEERKDAAN